jgi:hypothetical protein
MYVFISYSRIDSEIADRIADVLSSLDIRYFLDQKDIDWGDTFALSIAEAIKNATHLIVIVSPASLKSEWVPYEIGQAKANSLSILPYLIHPSLDMPSYLNGIHYLLSLEKVREYFARIKDRPTPLNAIQSQRLASIIDARFLRWIELRYTGRGSTLIPYDEFLVVNSSRSAFVEADKQKRAYLLRCAIQNGMGGQWGKWLLMNSENERIVEPLFVVLQGNSGWKPVWRAAYILQKTFGNRIASAISLLHETLRDSQDIMKVVNEIASHPTPDYLSSQITSANPQKANARMVLDEFRVFHSEIQDYANSQTVADKWFLQNR